MPIAFPSDQKSKRAASLLSLASNAVLTVLKLLVGVVSGSVSILAEAAHSTTDLIASGLTFYSVRQADRPPDRTHPYGHGKVENLSALTEGILLLGVAGYVIYEAIHKLISHARPGSLGLGMAVMAASALANVFVVRVVLRVGKQTNSQALLAVAQDHLADIISAGGVLLGLILVKVTGMGFFDPLMAILVSLLILWTAWHLLRGALLPLMDSQLPSAEVDLVRKVLEEDPNVLAYHKLRTRQAGAARFVDAHILMDDHMTLAQAHEFTEDVEEKVKAVLPNTEVTLHTEPYHAERQHQHEDHDGPPVADNHPFELDEWH